MDREESGTRSAPEEDCQSHGRFGCADVYMYLVVQMPWLKSRERRCSCSRVNCSDSFL